MKYQLKPQSFALSGIAGLLAWYLSGNFALGVGLFALLLMPGLISIYIPYAKDNPRHLWFKRKLYGWGWTPVTWEGWLATFIYVGLVAACGLTLEETSAPEEIALTFALPTLILTAAFIALAYKKGEKPRWQWGDDGK